MGNPIVAVLSDSADLQYLIARKIVAAVKVVNQPNMIVARYTVNKTTLKKIAREHE